MKLFAKRENSAPYFWVVRDESGKKIDRNQYSNDLREKYSDATLIFEREVIESE